SMRVLQRWRTSGTTRPAASDSPVIGPTVRRRLGACGEQTHSVPRRARPRSEALVTRGIRGGRGGRPPSRTEMGRQTVGNPFDQLFDGAANLLDTDDPVEAEFFASTIAGLPELP